MPYIFGKLGHLAIIRAIRKAFQSILQGVRFLLAKQTLLSPTSDNESYQFHSLIHHTRKKLASLDRVKWINLVRNGGSFEKLILWVVRTLGVTLDGKSYYPNIKFPKPHIFLPPIVMRFQLSSSLVGISLGFFPQKEWCNGCFLDKGMVQKTKWKF